MLTASVTAALLTAALSLTGVGPLDGGPPAPPAPPALPAPPPVIARQVDVAMEEYVFKPAMLDVKVGETITFTFTNNGKEIHDAFVGDEAAQAQHEEEMRSAEGHDHSHEGGVTVAPGESGAIRHFFDRPGTLEIGCHRVGHYKEGMKIILNVVPA